MKTILEETAKEPKHLKEEVDSTSQLKKLIVDFVGTNKNPKKDEVTVELIIELFAEQFPEFLLAVAEENWVNGYTQALSDVEYLKNGKKQESLDDVSK